MATPLFLPDTATLKKLLRLSGVPTDGDANEMIDEGVRKARTWFLRDLGAARVTEIGTYTYTETPTTSNELLRTIARETEVMMVRYELLCTMPAMFVDGSGASQDIWNEEAPFRDLRQDEASAIREKLLNNVIDNLDLLGGEESLGSESSIKATSIGPADAPLPGSSVFPNIGQLF